MASLGWPEVARERWARRRRRPLTTASGNGDVAPGCAVIDTAAMRSGAAVEASEDRAAWPPRGAVTLLPGVGAATQKHLAGLGIAVLQDLLDCLPRRYRELRELATPSEDALGLLVRLSGQVRGTRANWLPGHRSMVTLELVASDGVPFEAPFFNQPWLKKAWQPGDRRTIEGLLDRRGKRFLLRQARVLGNASPPGEVQLRYPELPGVSPQRLQQWIGLCLDRVDWDALQLPPLPPGIDQLPQTARQLYTAMHRPASVAEHESARRYFAVREALTLFAAVERARRQRLQRPGLAVAVDDALAARITARIPFALTADQQAATAALRQRLAGPAPMGVLLQGDVGTGKTAVAVFAALAVIARGAQVAFLAPTELLAEQHHAAASRWLEGSDVQVLLLSASLKPAERTALDAALQRPGPHFVFGTHALVSQRTRFANLGLVIVDEQHRFGVDQRMALVHKGPDPHVLVMTATPIPRTLALTLFGDLDAITLRQRPPGRRLVPAVFAPQPDWPRVLRSIARTVRRGGSVFVVCPAVGEDGEKGGAILVHRQLQKRFRCGLVHGRMPTGERQQVLQTFREHRSDVLVGTTVLEVGVDVPDATLMVVVAADRFGIATLHQLRGRVGRGTRRGLCILTGQPGPRIKAVCSTTDGFELAEHDLALRGSGELLGSAQSGHQELRALDPVGDLELLLAVRRSVQVG